LGGNVDIGEAFGIVKDIFLAAAAATTAYVAYTGIEKWKTELRGKANFDVARTLIKSVYKLRDEIAYCRSPFISAGEFPEGYAGNLGKRASEEEGQAYAHVYAKRWQPVSAALQEFDAAILEAEALWGSAIKERALLMRQAVRELQVSIEAVIDDRYSGGENFKDQEFAKNMRANIWAVKSQENKLSIKIASAIDGLENEIRPHLARS
jgi:hypothetical protein